MRITVLFSRESSTSCYLVAPRDGSGAILVDPVHLDAELYDIILKQEVDLSWILVTHPEPYMRRPLRTLSRVYDFAILSGESELFGFPSRRIPEDECTFLELEGLTVRAIPFLPHSRSSRMYLIGDALFTGTVLHAGTLGDTPSPYNEELVVAQVKDHLFTLPRAERDLILLPSVGPPSTIKAEQHLSPFYREHPR